MAPWGYQVFCVRANEGQCNVGAEPDSHLLTDIADGLGNRIHFTLDAAGRRTGQILIIPVAKWFRGAVRYSIRCSNRMMRGFQGA